MPLPSRLRAFRADSRAQSCLDSRDSISPICILASMWNISLCSTSVNAKIHKYLVGTRNLSAVHNKVQWVDSYLDHEDLEASPEVV